MNESMQKCMVLTVLLLTNDLTVLIAKQSLLGLITNFYLWKSQIKL
jgi:hypothetical protein